MTRAGAREDGGGAVGVRAEEPPCPETTQALAMVERILRACDASLQDVVEVTAYLADLAEWDAMNAAYVEVLGPHTRARIAVGGATLLFDARVEFDCVACRG